MLQEQQLIGDPAGLAILDQRLLQRQRLAVADDAEAPDLDVAARRPSSEPCLVEFSRRSFMKARNRPRLGAVDQPVIVAEREVAHRPDRDRVVDHDARFSMLPTPRIATCGWLISGRP